MIYLTQYWDLYEHYPNKCVTLNMIKLGICGPRNYSNSIALYFLQSFSDTTHLVKDEIEVYQLVCKQSTLAKNHSNTAITVASSVWTAVEVHLFVSIVNH